MKLKLKEIFNIHSGVSGLTERFIYENNPSSIADSIFVYSGSTNESTQFPSVSKKSIPINKVYKCNNSFVVARKGQAGKLTKPSGEFTINDNAYVFELKKEYENIVNVDYIIHKLPNLFNGSISDSKGNSTFNKTFACELYIDIPTIEFQNEYMKEYESITLISKELDIINNEIIKVEKSSLKQDGVKVKIKDLFTIITGLRLTENIIYSNQGTFPCVTAQTENNGIAWLADEKWLKTLTKNDNSLIIDKECITWTVAGVYAGTLFYRNTPFFLCDGSGCLIPKTNDLNIKWFLYTQKQFIKQSVTAANGNGALYKEVMENIEIKLPSIKLQNEIVREYDLLLSLKQSITNII